MTDKEKAIDEIMAQAEAEAEEKAREIVPEDLCSNCDTRQPLSGEYASDVAISSWLANNVAKPAAKKIQSIDSQSTFWVLDELSDTFLDAYYEAHPSSEKCHICQNPQSFDKCGHQLQAEACPVR